jgi:rod shape-determining protein MreB
MLKNLKSGQPIAPCVVMHPLGAPAAGFTRVECKAFREMAFGAGASEVFVWTGRPLVDQEILYRQTPSGRRSGSDE